MDAHHINRPDREAMKRLLQRHRENNAGTVLLLAWRQGLQREEMVHLTWDQVDFAAGVIRLPDRDVPLEAAEELRRLWERQGAISPYVLLSGKARAAARPMTPQGVSRLARNALDEEGMINIRLLDLRMDYIIRQLQEHDYSFVSRISGLEIRTLQLRFGKYAAARTGRARTGEVPAEPDEAVLERLLRTENGPAGLALALAWELGLSGSEIAALTWDQVDLEKGRLCLPDREEALTETLMTCLKTALALRTEDPHVLLTERSRKALDAPRLSHLTRSALVRGGMERLTLQDLQRHALRRQEEQTLTDAAEAEGYVNRRRVMELLGVTDNAAYDRLQHLTEAGRLVRVGAKYYLPGRVVPPERHTEAVTAYIAREGLASRQDIAALLGVEIRQSSLILKKLQKEGVLRREGQIYYLSEQ